jgi:hypothetical protein
MVHPWPCAGHRPGRQSLVPAWLLRFADGFNRTLYKKLADAEARFGLECKGDQDQRVLQWRPYVYWPSRPLNLKHLHIDKDGIRHTVAYDGSIDQSAGAPKKIFMFGSSTMWGSGTDDRYTIRSLFLRILHNSGRRVVVTNYGESRYCSTQEVITLLRELQRDNVPDFAIVYDGLNDTGATLQNRVAGVAQNESNR